MGTIVTIDVYTATAVTEPELSVLGGQLARARAVLHHADEVFSTWQPHSPVSRLRRGEISLSQAPPEVAEVLQRCAAARELSLGWFDPWAMPGGVDPTGYVKGWAAQNALAALSGQGTCGAIVNAAGDIASFGGLGHGQAFRIGIADPAAPRRLAAVIELTGAIATSGTYERGMHLIDPHSGRAVSRAGSASVTGPDLGLADALATALAVAGVPGLALIESLDGYEALLIGLDGGKRWTEAFPFTPLLRPLRRLRFLAVGRARRLPSAASATQRRAGAVSASRDRDSPFPSWCRGRAEFPEARPGNFDSILIHRFPGSRRSDEIPAWQPREPPPSHPPYGSLRRPPRAMALLDPPTSLMRPRMLWRVLRKGSLAA